MDSINVTNRLDIKFILNISSKIDLFRISTDHFFPFSGCWIGFRVLLKQSFFGEVFDPGDFGNRFFERWVHRSQLQADLSGMLFRIHKIVILLRMLITTVIPGLAHSWIHIASFYLWGSQLLLFMKWFLLTFPWNSWMSCRWKLLVVVKSQIF